MRRSVKLLKAFSKISLGLIRPFMSREASVIHFKDMESLIIYLLTNRNRGYLG